MALAHDKEGFLTGQPSNIDRASYARHLALLREIRSDGAAMRSDMAAIRKALSGPAQKVPQAVALPRASAKAANEPRIRTPGQTAAPGVVQQPKAKPVAPTALPESNRQRSQKPASEGEPSPIPRNTKPAAPRRADGRFMAKNAKDGDPSSPKDEKEARDTKEATSALSDAASDLSRGAGEMLAGTEQVDPTLAAAKEVKDIVSPALGLFKPLGRMFRRKPGASDAEKAAEKVADKSVPWYRRLWHELRDINKKSGKGGGFFASLLGLLGAIAGLIVKFTGLGKLARLMGGLAGGMRIPGTARGRNGGRGRPVPGRQGGSPGAPGGSSRRAPDGGERAGRAGRGGALKGMGKAALRRLPLVGALLAGGSALYSMFGGGDQSKQERFEGAGSGIGAIVGGLVGSLGGPLGTIAGAAIGDMVGAKVGTWLSTVDWSAVGSQISATWDTVAAATGKAFDGAVGFVKDSWTKVADQGSKVFSAVSDWFNEKLGIAKTALNTAATSVKDAAGRVAQGAKSAAQGAANYVGEKATAAKEAVVTKAANVKEAAVVQGGRVLGSLNKSYRHRESFDGIAGGASLQKFGTYTNEEADRIRTLKSGGYNTSANLPGGMSAATRAKIERAAIDAGHDPKEMLKIAAMESGGNANAISSTGAIGTYQFTGQTATGVGITNRFDEDQNIAGGMKLATQNKAALQKAGLSATAENLYMMHQLGPKAAFEVIGGARDGKRIDELSASTQDGVRKNYGAKSVTAADYLNTNRKALDDRYASVVGNTPASAPVAASAPPAPAAPSMLAAAAPGSAAPTTAPTTATTAAPVPQVPKLLAPISASAKPVSYTPAAPDVTRHAPKEAPPTTTPVGSSQKASNTPMRIETPITQNLGDRSIAAVATGGIGMQQLRV